MNFFINKAMGIGNSGVEHAQFYRARLFDSKDIPYKYIFTGLVKELPEAMKHWNIAEGSVMNIWEFYTFGLEYINKGCYKKNSRSDKIIKDSSNTHRIVQTVTSSGLLIKEHIEKSPNPKKPGTLIVARYKVEIFNFETGKRKIMFNEYNHPRRGRILENIHIYDFEGQDLFFKNEPLFQRFFFEELDKSFDGKNTFIIDRGEEPEVALFNHRFLKSNLIEIIHADHLGDRDVAIAPLWNNYYEYLLTHIEAVDRVVVSTELQREDLLRDFPDRESKFITIPVGGINNKKNQATPIKKISKYPTKFMTASRLASEKQITIAIKAIVAAHEKYPDITFDIYGQGSEEGKLYKLITQLKAEEYISLKGHSNNLKEVYKEYDAFVSASFSEGFGLTYIEALDAGLPVITFKARFGAMELIKDGENGFIRDFSRLDEKYNVKQLSDGIYKLLESDYNKIKQNTIRSVEHFQDCYIAEKWRDMLNEL
ncbi:glycosyltransferase [Lactococcus garvieae]